MPRPIKKVVPKPRKAEPETEIKDILSQARERLAVRSRLIVYVASALAAVALAIVGYRLYAGGLEEKAMDLFYEGYRNYYGLYEAEKLVKADRLNRALEGFRKSYQTWATPMALYYAASAEDALGRHDEAVKSLEELRQKFSGDGEFVPLALYKKATIEMKKGDNAGALKTFEELAAQGTPSFRDLALFESARLLELQGKRQDAMARYLSVAEHFPQSPYAEAARARAGITNAPEAVQQPESERKTGGPGVANQPQG